MAVWYCASNKWSAVTAWAALTAYSIGDIRRQLATPTVGNERVWRCTTAGTSGAAEPSWTLTKASTTSDGSVVWTEITGSSTYNVSGNWAAPHARLRNAIAWMAAADEIRMHFQSAATEAATITYTFPGTAAAYSKLTSVNDADTAQTAGALETGTGAFNMTFAGFYRNYGVSFTSGVRVILSTGAAADHNHDSNTFSISASGADFQPGSAGDGGHTVARVYLRNVIISFGNTNNQISPGCLNITWEGGSITGTIPTTLIASAGGGWRMRVIGVDLSAAGSGKNLFSMSVARSGWLELIDCKLGASVVVGTGTIVGPGGMIVRMVNCDSADTQYRYFYKDYQGTITHETTIVKASGASDGTTPVSRKMVTSANTGVFNPLVSDWILFFNATVGSAVAVSIPIVTDNVTLTDAEAWLEVEYLGTSGFPLGGFANDRVADPIFGTRANQTTDGVSSWTTTGLTTPVQQTLDVSVTPQEIGIYRLRVCLAKASTTLYYDPKAA